MPASPHRARTEWCEENGVDYLIGLGSHKRLAVLSAANLEAAKAEYGPLGSNQRYVVTSLKNRTPRQIYTYYGRRGEAENGIKNLKNALAADRLSSEDFLPNAFRLKSRRQEAHDQRYEAVRPNQLWYLDFHHRHIHKQPVYTLIILDDYSCFVIGGAIWDGERAAAVIRDVLGHDRPARVP